MSHYHTPTHENYPSTGQLRPASQSSLLLRNVRPYGEGEPVDVLLADGRIQAIEATDSNTAAQLSADDERDLQGNVLLPGLVDMHVHLREPGREDTETIASGSEAAARGGFTAVFTMANTQPVTDQPVIAESVWYKGSSTVCAMYTRWDLFLKDWKVRTSQNSECSHAVQRKYGCFPTTGSVSTIHS